MTTVASIWAQFDEDAGNKPPALRSTPYEREIPGGGRAPATRPVPATAAMPPAAPAMPAPDQHQQQHQRQQMIAQQNQIQYLQAMLAAQQAQKVAAVNTALASRVPAVAESDPEEDNDAPRRRMHGLASAPIRSAKRAVFSARNLLIANTAILAVTVLLLVRNGRILRTFSKMVKVVEE